MSAGRIAVPPGSWTSSCFWRRARSALEPLVDKGKEAGSVVWLQTPLSWVDPQVTNVGPSGPRLREGHSQALTEKGRPCPSSQAVSVVGPSGVSSGSPGLHSPLDGGSVHA